MSTARSTPACPVKPSPAPAANRKPYRLRGKERDAFEHTQLTRVRKPTDRAVLRAVFDAGKRGAWGSAVTWVGNAAIAKAAGVSVATVQRSLLRLEAAGVIRTVDDYSKESRRRIIILAHPGEAAATAELKANPHVRFDRERAKFGRRPEVASSDNSRARVAICDPRGSQSATPEGRNLRPESSQGSSSPMNPPENSRVAREEPGGLVCFAPGGEEIVSAKVAGPAPREKMTRPRGAAAQAPGSVASRIPPATLEVIRRVLGDDVAVQAEEPFYANQASRSCDGQWDALEAAARYTAAEGGKVREHFGFMVVAARRFAEHGIPDEFRDFDSEYSEYLAASKGREHAALPRALEASPVDGEYLAAVRRRSTGILQAAMARREAPAVTVAAAPGKLASKGHPPEPAPADAPVARERPPVTPVVSAAPVARSVAAMAPAAPRSATPMAIVGLTAEEIEACRGDVKGWCAQPESSPSSALPAAPRDPVSHQGGPEVLDDGLDKLVDGLIVDGAAAPGIDIVNEFFRRAAEFTVPSIEEILSKTPADAMDRRDLERTLASCRKRSVPDKERQVDESIPSPRVEAARPIRGLAPTGLPCETPAPGRKPGRRSSRPPVRPGNGI